MSVGGALAEVRQAIDRAALRAGREPSAVTLVAVSKLQPAEAIREVYEAGHRDFGESYVQELLAKRDELADLDEIRFHLIGHLQRNKARQVVGKVAMVQSVDSTRLLAELDRRAEGAGTQVDVLVEVNLGGEETKSGCEPEELDELVEAAGQARALRLRGLMTIPPYDAEPEAARRYFAELRELRERAGGASLLPELSMGMSGDFEVAVEEGSTIVRVGTAIFGARASR